jgi:hypothetical protein
MTVGEFLLIAVVGYIIIFSIVNRICTSFNTCATTKYISHGDRSKIENNCVKGGHENDINRN